MRDICRVTRKHHSAEDKIRVVLEGLRGEDSITALCRREQCLALLCCSPPARPARHRRHPTRADHPESVQGEIVNQVHLAGAHDEEIMEHTRHRHYRMLCSPKAAKGAATARLDL